MGVPDPTKRTLREPSEGTWEDEFVPRSALVAAEAKVAEKRKLAEQLAEDAGSLQRHLHRARKELGEAKELLREALSDDQDGYRIAPDLEAAIRASLAGEDDDPRA